MGDAAADVVQHPGRSGIHELTEARESPKSSRANDCDHEAHAGLWAMLVRGRGFSPLALVLALILGGGGAGIGGSWLLGPGSIGAAEIERRLDSIDVRQAEAERRLDRAAEAAKSCEAQIDDLADDHRALQDWQASAALVQAQAIQALAVKLGATVDTALPALPGRRRR